MPRLIGRMPELLQAGLLALLAGGFFSPGHAGAQTAASPGAAALARRDFAAAEAAWKPAAERGDAEAEFGLGEVFEEGRGDYSGAARWYKKAAEQGSEGARYRLALLYLAGNRQFIANVPTGYMWLLLATSGDSPNPHSEELRQLVEAHISAQDQEAGRREMEDFRRRENAARTPPSAPAPPANPKVAVVAPPPLPAPASSVDLNKAIHTIDCASLHIATDTDGRRVLSGTVPDEGKRASLVQIVGRLPEADRPKLNVGILTAPVCRSLHEFDQMRQVGLVSDDTLAAQVIGSEGVQHEGAALQVEVKSRTNYPINVRIDYFMLDGSVLHMWPSPELPNGQIAAGQTRLFNRRDLSGHAWEISAPFGTELIAVTATPGILDLGLNRPQVEMADDYLRDLEAALRKATNPQDRSNELATLLIHTAPK